MTLALRHISHRFAATPVLEDVTLEVAAGEVVCLLGPSGSGKSTLLRIAAGLEPLQAGEVWLEGRRIAAPGAATPAEHRGIGLVFQDHALFPHLTVNDNVAFGLKGQSSRQRAAIVKERLEDVGLDGFGTRYPHTLSGGQQQRVALARALAPQPAAMLLDEPFASVDATLRRRLREDARRALKANGCPAIVVTHDPDEALELADRIAVMVAGRIAQSGKPEVVWRHPASRFVAELFGDAQTLTGRVDDGRAVTAFGPVTLPPGQTYAAGTQLDVVLRPGAIRLHPGPGKATVDDVRFLGDRYLVIVAAADAELRATSAARPPVEVGDPVSVAVDPDQVLFYRAE